MNLALEKKKLEIKKVETAMLEMEYKVLERLADIERLKENINNQQKTIDRLKEEIEVTGDWISAEVNDKDGVIPEIYRDALTENYPTVSQYVIRANMSPDSSSKIYTLNTYPLNAKLTPGLYLMIKYHASSEIGTRSFVSNYYLSEKL